MKFQNFFLIAFVLLLTTLGITGCTVMVRGSDFTLASSKQFDVGAKYVKVGKSEGEDAVWYIFLFGGEVNMTRAVDNCISNAGGDLATNVIFYSKFTSYFVASKFSLVAKADIWKRASMGDLQNPDANIFELQKNDIGKFELQSTKYSSERYTVVDPSSPDVMNDVKVVQ